MVSVSHLLVNIRSDPQGIVAGGGKLQVAAIHVGPRGYRFKVQLLLGSCGCHLVGCFGFLCCYVVLF